MFSFFMSISTISLGLSLSIGGSIGGGSHEKSTGGITFQVGAACAQATFNAHEPAGNQAAKGVFNYRDVTPTGAVRLFQVKVQRCVVNGDRATFVGNVVMSNVPGWRDRWVRVWVRDGGTPGRNGDLLTFRFFPRLTDAATAAPITWFPATGGNLTVHSR
ncbi:MAG: hypothetical protein ACKVU4_08495 [Phycisphaerales bacterium]